MSEYSNKRAVADALMKQAENDEKIVILCWNSNDPGELREFCVTYPERVVEVGTAEQNMVGIAAGMAACGRKPFVFAPASFLTTRSYEQAKIDCAYSDTNVKLIGVAGGVSFGAMGMSRHSAQDIAAMAAIPNMRVYLPSDRHQTKRLIESLANDKKCAYVRLGRNPVDDVYPDGCPEFIMGRAPVLRRGKDVALIACGELVRPAFEAALQLSRRGIEATVVDMYCLKPLDSETILSVARDANAIITVEEHSPIGGLGSMVAQLVSEHCPRPVKCLSLPDAPVVAGATKEVFHHYGLDTEGIVRAVEEFLV